MGTGPNPRIFTLPSSNDWQQGRFRITRAYDDGGTAVLILAIDVLSKFWDRADGLPDYPLVRDSLFAFRQIVVEQQSLIHFQQVLADWIRCETSELRCDFKTLSKDQELVFHLQDFRGKRVLPDYRVNLICRSGKASAATAVPVDQTCITILHDTLVDALRGA
jgi:hypothetical protein